MPVAELVRALPRLVVSGAQCAMCSSFLAQQRVSLSCCLQHKVAEKPGLWSFAYAKDRAGFPWHLLKSFLLCRGEGRWGSREGFSITHPATDALGQRVHEIVDGKHHRADHEQSQYQSQLYINGHAKYSMRPVVGDRLRSQISYAFSARELNVAFAGGSIADSGSSLCLTVSLQYALGHIPAIHATPGREPHRS